MDLKVYYRKVREVEAAIPGPDVVVVSLETPDGGRPGVKSEVPKQIAAKLVVEGKARLSSDEEASEFREAVKEASQKAEEQASINQLQVAIVSDNRVKSPRGSKPQK